MADAADARRRAEEALATVAMRYPNGWDGYDTLRICTDALRALLAAVPEAKAQGLPRGTRSQNPDGTYNYDVPHDPDPNCLLCGGKGYTVAGPENGVTGCACNWTPLAPPPREYGPCPDYREGQSHAGCNLCGGLGTLPILSDADIAPPPPSDAVREAAEPSEAERLLRSACERLIGVPVAEQSRSLADISLAIDAALLRLRGEGGR